MMIIGSYWVCVFLCRGVKSDESTVTTRVDQEYFVEKGKALEVRIEFFPLDEVEYILLESDASGGKNVIVYQKVIIPLLDLPGIGTGVFHKRLKDSLKVIGTRGIVSLTVKDMQACDPGRYLLTVKERNLARNKHGTTSLDVHIIVLPKSSKLEGRQVTADTDFPVTFRCTATNTFPGKLRWRKYDIEEEKEVAFGEREQQQNNVASKQLSVVDHCIFERVERSLILQDRSTVSGVHQFRYECMLGNKVLRSTSAFGSSGLSGGAIAGIVIGVLVCVLLMTAVALGVTGKLKCNESTINSGSS